MNVSDHDTGTTPLTAAAEKGHAGVIEALLAKGREVNAKDNRGYTALMSVAEEAWTGIRGPARNPTEGLRAPHETMRSSVGLTATPHTAPSRPSIIRSSARMLFVPSHDDRIDAADVTGRTTRRQFHHPDSPSGARPSDGERAHALARRRDHTR